MLYTGQHGCEWQYHQDWLEHAGWPSSYRSRSFCDCFQGQSQEVGRCCLQVVIKQRRVDWWEVSIALRLLSFLVERPALAVRLDLSFRSVFFIREYLPNRWTYLNKSLHGDGKWSGIEHGGFEFLNFWGGLGWGPQMSLFARICPEWPSQNTIWRQNGERYQKSKTVLFWPDNFAT